MRSTTKWAVYALTSLLFFGCDSGSTDDGAAAIRIEKADGVVEVNQLRVTIKRERTGDAGVAARAVTENRVNVGDLADPFRVPAAWVPDGEGPVYLHAVAYAGDDVVGIIDASLGDGGGVHLLAVRALAAACDADGDTYVNCADLANECCAAVDAADRAAVSDCHDVQAELPANPGDTKRRDAATAHPFAASELGDDYFSCDNGVDDDCAGGDLPCDGEVDADEDGDPVGVDCDDADPEIGPSSYDTPGDGIDQDCNGADGQGTDADGDGYMVDDPDAARRDCDDANPLIHPGGGDIPCDGIDQDCSGADTCADPEVDTDGDGVPDADDCAPLDAGAYPGGKERCGDGVDQDCDGADLDCAGDDADGDGFGGDDCDDADPNAYPGAPEDCGDGIDQDCDGEDAACEDPGDGDGFLPPADCDDGDRAIHPHALEVCDGRDNDCDGLVDEGNPLRNADGDAAEPECGVCRQKLNVCVRGVVVCWPEDQPDPVEVCNGIDDDCDLSVDNPPAGADRMPDEGVEVCGPQVEEGVCVQGRLYCRNGALDDCRGAVMGSDEACNGADDDCDGQIDEGEVGGALAEQCFDGDEGERNIGSCVDGLRECVMSVEGGAEFGACRNQVLAAEETCNGDDDDCDGAADELAQPCYTFEDGVLEGDDGELVAFGECRVGTRTCDGDELGVCEGQVGPTEEVCDGLDNNCDNMVDQFQADCFGEDEGEFDAALAGVGICRLGRRVCIDGNFGECVGDILPAVETCDGRDNDCDGFPDEDFDRQTDPDHCGVCNRACGAGEQCCSGACRDTASDTNCGGCGISCIGRADRCVVLPGADAPVCRCGEGAACDEQSGPNQNLVCRGGACICERDGDCADNELCCGGTCQPTGPGANEQCEACGEACPQGLANVCENRECTCGDGADSCTPPTVCALSNGAFRCVGCRDNQLCPGNQMCCNQVCVGTNPEQRCGLAEEACQTACNLDIADFCQGENNGLERTCVCGSGPDASACRFFGDDDARSLYCLRGAAEGDGHCVQCRDDADCPVVRAGNGQPLPDVDQKPRCVDNRCERCDPGDHDPCGLGQLCCGLRCVPTSELNNGICEGCGTSCDEDDSNVCADRSCRCGGNAPCDGATPFCLDEPGRCVECRTDNDCGGGLECVNFQCKVCDPANHDGCGAEQLCCVANGEPSCEATNDAAGQCEACDLGCNALATNRCTGRSCQCGGNAPCAGETPVCDDNRRACVECTADAHCNGHADGNQCVDFQCQPCDPADHAGCGGNQLCCGVGDTFACQATQGGAAGQCEQCGVACGTRSDACLGRVCSCGAGDACDPQGADPFCVGGACEECRGNNDCAGDELCCAGACEATGEAANEQCEQCGAACDQEATDRCVSRSCDCGAGDECGEPTPVCDGARCVQCTDNGDCNGRAGTSQCVETVCEECDPVNHGGCGESDGQPICDAASNECRTCRNDAECIVRPGVRNECVTGRCRRCDPNDDSGCNAALPVCDDETFSCRTCENHGECPGNLQCVGGRCEGCDPQSDAPCGGGTPICDPVALQCRACGVDGECAARPGNEDQCVDGRCAACDPGDHAGCNANQLCCGFQCQATAANTQCESCGQACDADSTDGCGQRTCECGGNAECGGQTAFCDDPNDVCVNCRADGDCDAQEPQCVSNRCEVCDPDDDAGCAADGGEPVCDAGNKTCRACGADAECAENGGNGGQCVADGECEACDSTDDAGCVANSTSPICAGNPESCRGCNNNAECAGNGGNGAICAEAGARDGACGACDPADDQGCNNAGASPVCDANTLSCRGCANDGDCADNARGDQCLGNGRCRPCDPNGNQGCDAGSNEPVCRGGGQNFQCSSCQDDGQCAGNPNGEQCVAGGACKACDPADNAGCGGGTPICDGGTFTCRACANDGECGADFCVAGACEACDPDGNGGCDAGGAVPICRGNPLDCRACNNNNQCAQNPNGNVCSPANGCRQCDPADHEGCDAGSNAPVCDGQSQECRGCANDAECSGNANGEQCVNGACQACDVANDDGCDAGGGTPICGGNPPACGPCGDDLECAGNANGNLCTGGSCVACAAADDCAGHVAGNVCTAPNCVSCDNDDQNCVGHPAGEVCGGNDCGPGD